MLGVEVLAGAQAVPLDHGLRVRAADLEAVVLEHLQRVHALAGALVHEATRQEGRVVLGEGRREPPGFHQALVNLVLDPGEGLELRIGQFILGLRHELRHALRGFLHVYSPLAGRHRLGLEAHVWEEAAELLRWQLCQGLGGREDQVRTGGQGLGVVLGAQLLRDLGGVRSGVLEKGQEPISGDHHLFGVRPLQDAIRGVLESLR